MDRVFCAHLVSPVGQDEQSLGPLHPPAQVFDQIQAGLVRPVDILEYQDRRPWRFQQDLIQPGRRSQPVGSRIQQLEQDANQRYRAKEQALQEKLKDAEQKLQDLGRGGQKGTEVLTRERRREIWDTWLWLVVVLALAGTEWSLRKLWGLL